MDFDDKPRDTRGAILIIGFGVFIITVIVLIVGLVWIFIADSSSNVRHVTTVDSAPVYDEWYMSDAANELLDREGIDLEIGDLNVEGGDPSSDLALSLNRILPTGYVAVPIGYDYIQFLPAPCIVWIAEAKYAKPVILISSDEASVTAIDPGEGEMTYPFSRFSQMYVAAGRKAVCITDRGYDIVS